MIRDTPPVTIALPFFNASATLYAAIASILAQRWTDWELLLLDDGSTDGSLSLAAGVNDRRIRLYSDGTNRGLSYRLNQSAVLASGKYLARMDADDLMHPDRLSRQLAYLESHREVDVVGTSAYVLDRSGNLIGRRDGPVDIRPAAVLARGLFIHPTVMGRVNWFRRNRYDERYVRAEDHDLWCRTCRWSCFAHLSEMLYFYRESGSEGLEKYVGSGRTDRLIYRQYGPAVVGLQKTRRLIAGSFAKVGIYRLLRAIQLDRWLITRRNTPLTNGEYKEGGRILREIQATVLPADRRLVTVESER